MALEVAIGKRAKISKAQQNMLLSVLGASVVLGTSISLTVHFVKQISFNTEVIMAEEKSIADYSNVIKSTGICQSPKGDVYSGEELKKCDPNSIQTSQIPGTLRANILEKLAANEALNSVPKEVLSNCINPNTDKNYTFDELEKNYDDAAKAVREGANAQVLTAASQLIKNCSALRVIPDALPANQNEEALLASLNKIFIDSGWQPESLSPGGSASSSADPKLKPISVRLSVEADTGTTMKFLNNVERSIREFNIERATIEWGSNNTLSLSAQATAYYTEKASISESTKTIKPEGKKK